MIPAADGPEFPELFTVTADGVGGGVVAVGGAGGRISLPGTGGNAARSASIGIVIVCPARLTEFVHAVPSQYRPSLGEVGSWYQPAGGLLSGMTLLGLGGMGVRRGETLVAVCCPVAESGSGRHVLAGR